MRVRTHVAVWGRAVQKWRVCAGPHDATAVVDMLLAVVVTGLVWLQLDFLCPAKKVLPQRHPAHPPDKRGPLKWLFIGMIFVVLLSPFIIIVGGGA